MPSLFRQKRRSTISGPGVGPGSRPNTPLGTPPIEDVSSIEPFALHKLRTLLHRGSRMSLRVASAGTDDSRPHSVRHATPPPGAKELHVEAVALAHEPDSGSASTTPPSEVSPLPETEPAGLDAHHTLPKTRTRSHPEPLATLINPTPQNTSILDPAPAPDGPLAPPPAQLRPPMADPTPPRSPGRPQLALDTAAAAVESPTASPFQTPHASAPQSPEDQHFATPSDRTLPWAIPEPPSPMRDVRIGSDPMYHLARRRSSAMSAMSAMSAHTIGTPRRMAAVLHSPPMPIPIARLPSLNNGGVASPTWGVLAVEGGPLSPALSRTNSRASATGFPFPQPVPTTSNSKELTDSEVRRATKSMPVMLRVPSRQPAPEPEDEEDDEDDDDDDDDSADGRGSTAAPLAPAPPPAHSAYANRGAHLLNRPTMDPVSEESRAGTPLPSSRAASSVGSPVTQRQHLAQGFFDHDRLPSGADDTPSSLGLHSAQWSSTSHVEADDDAYSGVESLDSASVDDTASGSVAMTSIATPSPATPPPLRRPGLSSQISRSMIDLSTPQGERTAAPRVESPEPMQPVDEVPPPTAPALDWAHPPTTPWGVTSPPPLKRRLSAGDADPPPPKYESVKLDREDAPVVKPREEEGREQLPGYWCGVHIEGTLSRKMEFSQPGVQARDRGWKKHYFVLHGTALFVYKFDPCKVPLRMGEPYLTVSEQESQEFLHVHVAPDHHRASASGPNPVGQAIKQARRATVGQEAAPRINVIATAISNARRGTVGSHTPTRRDAGSPGIKDPSLFDAPKRRRSSGADSVASSTASAPIASHMPFAHNQLVHVYSMNGAESGLAADYKKRMHCVRVRVEGQQFMLQTDTARQCVQWIEAFQAATNVAMDLDTRPMPVQQTLPRRRRRRRVQPAAEGADFANPEAAEPTTSANPAFDDTPEGNIAAVIAAERAEAVQRDQERDRMLAEDQAAEAGHFRT